MTWAAREQPTPLDAMLDLAEQSARMVIEHGGAFALARRLERLLGEPLPVPAPAERAATAGGLDPAAALQIANALGTLADIARRTRMSAADHDNLRAARTVLARLIEPERRAA